MKINETLVIDAEPLETLEAPVTWEDFFRIVGAAAALGVAIAHAIS